MPRPIEVRKVPIEHVSDAGDKRRTIVRLSQEGLDAVESFFDTYLNRKAN